MHIFILSPETQKRFKHKEESKVLNLPAMEGFAKNILIHKCNCWKMNQIQIHLELSVFDDTEYYTNN